MQRKVAGALVVALALALGTAGCGGSGPLTKAEFVKQGNAACAKSRTRVERLKTRDDGATALLVKIVAYEHAKAAGIAALEPPDALRSSYEQYRGALSARGSFFGRYLREVRDGRRPHGIEVAAAEQQAREDQAARALGLTQCLESASG